MCEVQYATLVNSTRRGDDIGTETSRAPLAIFTWYITMRDRGCCRSPELGAPGTLRIGVSLSLQK